MHDGLAGCFSDVYAEMQAQNFVRLLGDSLPESLTNGEAPSAGRASGAGEDRRARSGLGGDDASRENTGSSFIFRGVACLHGRQRHGPYDVDVPSRDAVFGGSCSSLRWAKAVIVVLTDSQRSVHP